MFSLSLSPPPSPSSPSQPSQQPPSQAPNQPTVVSAFPFPPQYYLNYHSDPSTWPKPPKPLPLDSYQIFGGLPIPKFPNPHDPVVFDGFEIEKLWSDEGLDHKRELKALNAKLVKNFLGLLQLLTENSDQTQQKITEIETIMLNMQHLLNSYRPHQTRETLVVELERQIKRRKQTALDIQTSIEEAKKILAAAQEQLDDSSQTRETQSELV
eukprot:TRINITY_DN1451_c0_g1_i1.p1 TRINITY_DN1451_c0_g1~~TRINITY_DN1451_c0_g1_i1.p1  ORF type:complete len:211 (+),score=48.52 TRINITY_DN1451_c0_g1_i1:73-705(+)